VFLSKKTTIASSNLDRCYSCSAFV